MQNPEEKLIEILQKAGVDFTASLPCEKIKALIDMTATAFFHVPLTREEEGVGICAGAALAGKKPAMFIQSSGVGNLLNALLSLTGFYELPLALFISHRGGYEEKIEAQVPMGKNLAAVLEAAGISCSEISSAKDFTVIKRKLPALYKKNDIHAFLLSPAIWAESSAVASPPVVKRPVSWPLNFPKKPADKPAFTRYEILKMLAPKFEGKVVVCNLGIPSKELYRIKDQPSNFYMLGSMGMATPIGLGISLSSKRDVIVIDGDGSLLMNPGTLGTAAAFAPDNLTILAIDNSSYGSTGGQATLTGSCADLELIARGFGIKDTVRAWTEKQITHCIQKGRSMRFVHIPALPGNRDVSTIPLDRLEIKKRVSKFLVDDVVLLLRKFFDDDED